MADFHFSFFAPWNGSWLQVSDRRQKFRAWASAFMKRLDGAPFHRGPEVTLPIPDLEGSQSTPRPGQNSLPATRSSPTMDKTYQNTVTLSRIYSKFLHPT